MKNQFKSDLMLFIRASLGSHEPVSIPEEEYGMIYKECRAQAITGLPADILANLTGMPEGLKAAWKKEIIRLLYDHKQYVIQQEKLVETLNENKIGFVILKGTAAAQYYKNPEFRTMGDIDVMPRREQFEKTCSVLMNVGYAQIAYDPPYKCMELAKDNVVVEVHRYFAKMNDPVKAEYLDNLITENIHEGTFVLPDAINGLVLLQHVDHHLENGIGLRQIIDWQMFANRYLTDSNWHNEFQKHARAIGLEELAKVLTHMCQMYLGLRNDIHWCSSANRGDCTALLEYIMNSGNFGNKIEKGNNAVNTIIDIHNPIRFLRETQKNGLYHLERDNNSKWPRCLAWCYQLRRLVKILREQHYTLHDGFVHAISARKRRKLFDKLNVKREANGLAVYKDGKFIRE